MRVDFRKGRGDGGGDGVVYGVDDAGECQQDDDVGVGEEDKGVNGVLGHGARVAVEGCHVGFSPDDGDDGVESAANGDAAVAGDRAECLGEEEQDA